MTSIELGFWVLVVALVVMTIILAIAAWTNHQTITGNWYKTEGKIFTENLKGKVNERKQ